MVKDLLNQIQYTNTLTNREYEENLPQELIMGLAIKPMDLILLSADLKKGLYRDQSDLLNAGLEVNWENFIFLRGGASRYIQGEGESYHLGGGLQSLWRHYSLRLDYAYSLAPRKASYLAGQQVFSIQAGF
jgi:hypothetical protein